MADPQRPWSNDERNFLLAEIIKQQSPLPSQLFGFLTTVGRAEPRWEDMPLPPGRTLNQCRTAFEELRTQVPQPQAPPMFMTGAYGLETPRSAPAAAPPKRTFQLLDAPFPGRQIRPKPVVASSSMPQAITSEPAAKRKRGRPTKAQAQAKAAAEAAAAGRSEAGPAPRPMTPAQSQAAAQAVIPAPTGALNPPTEEPRPTLQAPARMQISAVLTPANPTTASSSSSSSGKRRRGRSTRSEQGAVGEVFGGPTQQYESPYGRAAENLEDTPAQTARMRHREEQQTQATQGGRPQSTAPSYGPGSGSVTQPPPSGGA